MTKSDPNESFTSQFFSGNRAKLRQLVNSDAPIVVTANGLLQRNGDNTYRFRQDSSFWYLTGSKDPDIVLVMDGDKEYFIVPKRDPVIERFEGSIDTEAMIRQSVVKEVLDGEAGWQRLTRRLKQCKQVAVMTPPPAYLEFHQFYTNPSRAALVQKMQAVNPDIELVDIREHLAKLRVVKQPAELAAIRKAVDVTVDGLLHVTEPGRLRSYRYENEIEADLTYVFRRAGYGHAFDPIVAGGKRGAQMHAFENNGAVRDDEMIILDVGAEVGLYAADVARTVIAGQPSKRQQALYDAVCAAQDYAYSLIKPGVVHIDYEKQNEAFIGEKLRELGIIDETDRESVRRHFPHMMSHFVGLEPHDVGDYQQAMQVGTVMVVEPGMYSYSEGLGVRLEDVVVITEDGYELLSERLPRKLG